MRQLAERASLVGQSGFSAQALPVEPVRADEEAQVPTALLPFSKMSAHKLRRNIAVMHATLLWAAFLPPFILCLNLAANSDFRYFVGSMPLLSFWIVLFICFVPLIDIKFKPQSWWFLMSAWLPALSFVLLGEFCRQGASNARSALENQDCMGFGEKRNLQKAYLDATSLYQQCTEQPNRVSITECAGYPALERDWPKELSYLEAIETQHPCAGICHQGIRLWESPGRQAPACSLYVSQWLYGGQVQANIILWYSIVLLLMFWGLYELLTPMMKEYWAFAISTK